MPPAMPRHVLAFDTSATVTSVAICAGSTLLAEQEHAGSDRHAEVLLPRVQACLSEAGLALGDIDLVGVGIGPGSFTGVRVGVATAKGLALGLTRPVCGVVSLEALALAALQSGNLLAPLLDAFKGEVFGALYRVTSSGLSLELAPFHADPASARAKLEAAAAGQPLTLFGGGLRRYQDVFGAVDGARLLDASFDAPRARFVAQLALGALERDELPDAAALTPLYLRDSDAQLPKTPLRL